MTERPDNRADRVSAELFDFYRAGNQEAAEAALHREIDVGMTTAEYNVIIGRFRASIAAYRFMGAEEEGR